MTAIEKSELTLDMSAIVDGETIDAADVNAPLTGAQTHLRNGRVAVSASDSHIKHLEDALEGVTGNFAVTKINSGGNEKLRLNLSAAGVSSGHVPIANGDGTFSWGAQGGGGATPVDVTVVAGETLAQRDVVYLEMDTLTAYKMDPDGDPPGAGPVRGIVNEPGGIAETESGTIRLIGEVSGFSSLTPGVAVYAGATPGTITQTRPDASPGGGQVAVIRLGFATSSTNVMVWPGSPTQYVIRDTVSDDGTLTLRHHADSQAHNRRVRAYISATTTGQSATSYGSGNHDVDVALKKQLPNYSTDVTGSGTASANNEAAPASQAFDNNTTTHWRTAAGHVPGWIRYDFGSGNNKTVVRCTIRASTGFEDEAPGTFDVQGSANGTDWTTIHSVSGQTFGASETKTYTWANTTAYRYWRLNISSTPSGSRIAIAEMEYMEIASYSDGADKLAQSFQVGAGTEVISVRLWLRKVGGPTGDVTVKIETDSAGSPSGTPVSDGTSNASDASSLGTSFAWVDFTFPDLPEIDGSTPYWLVLETTDSQSPSNYIEWGADGSSPGYTNGEMKSHTGSWSAESKDAIFDVFAPGTSFEEPASIQRWSMDDALDVAVRFDDGAGGDIPTSTTFKNVTGVSADLTVVVELE